MVGLKAKKEKNRQRKPAKKYKRDDKIHFTDQAVKKSGCHKRGSTIAKGTKTVVDTLAQLEYDLDLF